MKGATQRLIPLSDKEEWSATLTGIEHAFAHTWDSCYAMQLTTGWPTYLYEYKSDNARVVCPIAEREFGGHLDVVTPYGFSGFAATGEEPSFLKHWNEFAQKQKYVCGYISLNPLFAPPACRDTADYLEYNDIYVLQLNQSKEQMLAAMSQSRRRQLRAFEKGASLLIEDWDLLAEFFVEHVNDFFASKGADVAYSFSPATLKHLLALDNTLIIGAGAENEVDAICLFSWSPNCAEYLFGVSLPEAHTLLGALLWHGALRIKSKGIPRLNLGGGVRPGDGVAEFKERFGGAVLPLGALKQVYRPDIYVELCRKVAADPAERGGYFPAFRKHSRGLKCRPAKV